MLKASTLAQHLYEIDRRLDRIVAALIGEPCRT
jgi:hypothetical protein